MAMSRRARNRRRIAFAAVIALVLLALGLARFYTDVLWFQEVGFSSVLWTSLLTQLLVGVAVGVAVGIFVWANLALAARARPSYRLSDLTDREDPLDRYRDALAPYLRWIRMGIAGGVGLLSGLAASSGWETFLLWRNAVSFGATDPQFKKDIGFYVFQLPFFDLLLDWVWFAVVATLVLTVGAHYFFGAIRPEARLGGITRAALGHVSVLLGIIALIKAGQYWLGRYQLNFSGRGQVVGASYTDVHAQLPALNLLVVISIISAGLFIANIRFRRFSLPLAAVGIWVLTAFLAGGVWPWAIQRFSVEPQEPQRERPYILRNLAATREAFGLDQVRRIPFPASEDLTPEDLTANGDMLRNVRLWDPAVLKDAYKPLQAIRTYYRFEDVDIDRYPIDGEVRQVMVSARELSLEELPDTSKTWQNLHLQYTHGFGLVASLANESTTAGQPEFLVKNVPGTVEEGAESLELDQPRIYYGEGFDQDEYSIVNSKQEELDYPLQEGQVARSNYGGIGGIETGNILRRIAFAIREGDPNLVLSSLITPESRALIYRNVRDRIARAAPFLALDNDAYPVVVDGGLKWVLDAYTTTNFFPYSERFNASLAVARNTATLSGVLNYVRNSVKVVVDAYDGTMQFYIVDPDDPLIQAWRKVFPDLFSDAEPPDELVAHFRYPEDLFKVQSDVYRTYHMEDPLDFYSKEDEWAVPEPPTIGGTPSPSPSPGLTTTEAENLIDPLYLLFRLPGEEEQEFLLTRPFTARARSNMVATMVARSDPEHYGELAVLLYPRSRLVYGPQQADNLVNQDVEFSPLRTLLNQQGSKVQFGSLVILPIEDSLLYIQPAFVTAENVGIPELKRVLLVFGEEVVIGNDFEEALAELFQLQEPPAPAEERPRQDREPPRAEDGGLEELVARAAALYGRAQEALAAGDFESYGRLIERLGTLLERAAQ